MIIVKRSEIEEETEICPYCMTKPTSMQRGCCGESSDHWQTAYGVKDRSDWILADDVDELIEDTDFEDEIGEFLNE